MAFLDTGIYILEIKDDRDCILRDTINLTSFASLELDITPNNPSICQGTSIDLTVNGGATYFWYPSSSLSSSTGSIVQATPQTTTTYFVVAQGINGCQDTVHVNVGVIPSPNLSTFPNNVSICQGDTVSVIISGGSNYNWSPNVSIDNINLSLIHI